MSDNNQELATIENTNELIFNKTAMTSMMELANIMASSNVTIPNHLKKSVGDCFAVVMQAAQWKMNPFAVAQKTHIVNGALGYEAQLVNAVIMASGAISGTFNYEYKGEGNNISCRVGAILKGQQSITWGEWLSISSVTTKNSPLWKTNEKQQMGYLQVKNWSRAYCPGAILGVYSTDELEDNMPQEKIINPMPNQSDQPTKFQELIAKISALTADQLLPSELMKHIDISGLEGEEITAVKAGISARRKLLKEAAVVADIKPEPEQKKPKDGDNTDWKNLIDNAQSQEELTATFKSMPPDVATQFNDIVDDKMDSLRGL